MSATVLIAEDEFFVRFTIAEFLRQEGYQVIEADNAETALGVFLSGTQVDLLFTDVRMPGSMDGCALAKRVRAEWPGTKIIMTTGYAPELLTARSVAEDRVVSKPYRPEAVLATIRSLVDARSGGG